MTDAPAQGTPPESSVAARWPGFRGDLERGPRPRISLGIPALDDIAPVFPDLPHVIVIALPWEPAGETPFVITQSLARQGVRPLCLYPSWSPYWDGALDVHRVEDIAAAGPVPYADFGARAQAGDNGVVVIDQFSRLHWDAVTSHAAREDVATEASHDLLRMAKKIDRPAIVFTRRQSRNVARMSVDDLRSDGALEYDAQTLVMVDPHPETATADLLVVKHRNGPTGLLEGVSWPVLPRTVYRRSER